MTLLDVLAAWFPALAILFAAALLIGLLIIRLGKSSREARDP